MKLFTQGFISMIMLSELMNQRRMHLKFCGLECVVKKVVKGIVMDPCAQLFTWSTSDKAPKGQITMSDLFTPTHTHTHTHRVSETPKGLTSLCWLTFHQGRRGRWRDTLPHLGFPPFFTTSLLPFYSLYLQLFAPSLLSLGLPTWTQLSLPSNYLLHGAFIKPFIHLSTSIFNFSCGEENVSVHVCVCMLLRHVIAAPPLLSSKAYGNLTDSQHWT